MIFNPDREKMDEMLELYFPQVQFAQLSNPDNRLNGYSLYRAPTIFETIGEKYTNAGKDGNYYLDIPKMATLFHFDNFKDNYRVLNQEVRKLGFDVPPLFNAYMNLSPKMRVFGTAINGMFGDVEETGILIAIDEILEEKKKRHIVSYFENT